MSMIAPGKNWVFFDIFGQAMRSKKSVCRDLKYSLSFLFYSFALCQQFKLQNKSTPYLGFLSNDSEQLTPTCRLYTHTLTGGVDCLFDFIYCKKGNNSNNQKVNPRFMLSFSESYFTCMLSQVYQIFTERPSNACHC